MPDDSLHASLDVTNLGIRFNIVVTEANCQPRDVPRVHTGIIQYSLSLNIFQNYSLSKFKVPFSTYTKEIALDIILFQSINFIPQMKCHA